jgi:hypothetical protein
VIVVDVSILIYSHVESFAQHQAARDSSALPAESQEHQGLASATSLA